MTVRPDDPNRWSYSPRVGLGFAGVYKSDAYKKIWTPNNNVLSVGYSVNNVNQQGNSGVSFSAASFGGTSKCSSSTDCGAGFVCSSGVCVPSGGGNTYPGSSGTGCNSGQNGVDTATPGNSCGGKSGTGLGDCYQAGCGQGGNVGCASEPTDGPRCCRYGYQTIGKVGCWAGDCPPEPDECSSYCTGHKASYGDSGPSCDDRNECSECTACEDGQCVDKADKPCHCDESCAPPGPELTCCGYRDTCEGRLPGPYCHDTYRTYYPRCYDPTHPCPPPPPSDPCRNCTTGEGTSVPEGCQTTGTITVGSNTRYTYECCTPSNAPECQPPKMYVRISMFVWGDGWFSGPQTDGGVTEWIELPQNGYIGTNPTDLNVPCIRNTWDPRSPWPSNGVIEKQDCSGFYGCVSSAAFFPLALYDGAGQYVRSVGFRVGIDGYYASCYELWFEAQYEISFNQGNTSSGLLQGSSGPGWPESPETTLPDY